MTRHVGTNYIMSQNKHALPSIEHSVMLLQRWLKDLAIGHPDKADSKKLWLIKVFKMGKMFMCPPHA